MAKDIRYALKRNGYWLQEIEANKNYVKGSCAPTMGARHSFSEYKTIWGKEIKFFEHLTFANYLKVLFEEYRWESRVASDIKIVTKESK